MVKGFGTITLMLGISYTEVGGPLAAPGEGVTLRI